MIYVFHAIDPTTAFLSQIVQELQGRNIEVEVIEILPSNESYAAALAILRELPDQSTILFLGHGQFDKLYGGESPEFAKATFVGKNQMNIFANKKLFALACNSVDLLHDCRFSSGIIKAIGFASLPTEMKEVEASKTLKVIGVDQVVLDDFKEILIRSVSQAFIYYVKRDVSDFHTLLDYFRLLISREINKSAIEGDKWALVNLLFLVKSKISCF